MSWAVAPSPRRSIRSAHRAAAFRLHPTSRACCGRNDPRSEARRTSGCAWWPAIPGCRQRSRTAGPLPPGGPTSAGCAQNSNGSRRATSSASSRRKKLKQLAAYLQPFFLEPPPDVHARGRPPARGLAAVAPLSAGSAATRSAALTRFLTGSLGDFLDRHFESDKLKRLILANSLYGKHGGPYQPGTAMGLLFHLLSGGDADQQGFRGTSSAAWARSPRPLPVAARARRHDSHERAGPAGEVTGGKATGVTLSPARCAMRRSWCRMPIRKRTFLTLVEAADSTRNFAAMSRRIRMDGPCRQGQLRARRGTARRGMPAERTRPQRSLFTLVPTLDEAEASYNAARAGRMPEQLWVDCVLASNVDDSLAPPGRHMLTCFVQYVPYHLRESPGTRSANARRPVTAIIGEYAPNVPSSVIARCVLTPLDLERASASPKATSSTATSRSNRCSSCGRCPAGRTTARRSRDCISAAPAHIPAAASPARPATTPPAASSRIRSGTCDGVAYFFRKFVTVTNLRRYAIGNGHEFPEKSTLTPSRPTRSNGTRP